jgi:hypothetical protein
MSERPNSFLWRAYGFAIFACFGLCAIFALATWLLTQRGCA